MSAKASWALVQVNILVFKPHLYGQLSSVYVMSVHPY